MPAVEPVEAWRAVAEPAALDAARWEGDGVDVLRIAPDEALGLGATGVVVDDDPDAILEPDRGWSVALVGEDDLVALTEHVEWALHGDRPLLQGKVAGVPARMRLGEPTLLVVQTCYVDELRRRLGW